MTLSTLSLLQAPRRTVNLMQRQLVQAQTEATTGRLSDIPVQLGYRTAQAISLRTSFDHNETRIDMNKLTANTLDITQQTLSSLGDITHKFAATLLGSRNAIDGQKLAREAARTALQTVTTLLNTTSEGQYIFAGLNSAQAPIPDYQATPASAGKTAVDGAFSSYFGFSQNDPAVGSIPAAQMEQFLGTQFASLFANGNWQGTFSTASDTPRQARIDQNISLDVSATANERPIRDLVMSITAVLDLGTGSLNQGSFEKLVDKATAITAAAAQQLGAVQSRLGVAQQEITSANTRMTDRNVAINRAITTLEGVDPYEAAARVNSLSTQLETSYSITARLSRLNLMNYL